jgi:Tfp pilus assembly protein PilZ
MGRNRRKHPRVRARDLGAQILTATGRIPAQVENISRGGAFVRTDRPLEVGSDMMVELARPGLRRVLSLAARVTSRIDPAMGRISKRAPGMGMMFISLDARQTDRLVALLKELGAPDSDGAVTLSDDATELELQALSLDDVLPMAPADAPLWQQTDLAKREITPPPPVRAETAFDLPQHLADDIEGALRDADLPSPGPLEVNHHDPRRHRPPPVVTEPPPPAQLAESEAAKLMLQLRGLVMQLSDAQQQLSDRELEIGRLREELAAAREVRDSEIARLRKDLDAARSALQRALRNSS